MRSAGSRPGEFAAASRFFFDCLVLYETKVFRVPEAAFSSILSDLS